MAAAETGDFDKRLGLLEARLDGLTVMCHKLENRIQRFEVLYDFDLWVQDLKAIYSASSHPPRVI